MGFASGDEGGHFSFDQNELSLLLLLSSNYVHRYVRPHPRGLKRFVLSLNKENCEKMAGKYEIGDVSTIKTIGGSNTFFRTL